MLELKYEIRDVVHGLIGRTAKEVEIINTRVFQRLRRINQLAMAQLVYPGAHHNRFEHCLGTMHIAGKISEKLVKDGELKEREIEIIRLSGLLHDIGHGPFSHVSEYLLEKYYDEAKAVIGPNRAKIHELVTKDIIEKNDELGELLTDNERTDILNILHAEGMKDFKRDIVSGPLDADKLDYLLRDNYYCGVRYGIYDLDKIVDSLKVIKLGEESYLGIDADGIYALEQLIIAKHHMTTQVYFHKIRGITDSMIIRGIELAIQEGLGELERAFQYDGTAGFLAQYYQLYDSYVIDLIMNKGKELSKEFFGRLFERRLFKMAYKKRIADMKGARLKKRYSNLKEEDKTQLEGSIAEKLKIRPEMVIVNILDIKNPTYRPPGLSVDDETILVDFKEKEREPEQLRDIEWSILNLANPLEKSQYIQVYAKLDYLNEIEDAVREKQRLSELISDIVEK